MKKGFNAYFWILILIILLAIWISYTSRPDSNNSLETIYDAIESQEIESVVTIYPGSVSPTGTVETVIDGVKVTAHVTNVDDVANMCLADFLGSSVPTEEHLAKYIKYVLDDPDAKEGLIFNRYYSDTVYMDEPIDWEEMV